jgi:NAD(P)-dependent dehydrogenase (short-subunit alcohol dehydrogenase family)
MNEYLLLNLMLLISAAVVFIGNVEEVSTEDWSRVFNVSLRGYALTAKHIVPLMPLHIQ